MSDLERKDAEVYRRGIVFLVDLVKKMGEGETLSRREIYDLLAQKPEFRGVERKGLKIAISRGISNIRRKGLLETTRNEITKISDDVKYIPASKIKLFSKEDLEGAVSEGGSYLQAAIKLDVGVGALKGAAQDYGIDSPYTDYKFLKVMELLEGGPKTTSEILDQSDIENKDGWELPSKTLKQYKVVLEKMPGTNEHIYYLPKHRKMVRGRIEKMVDMRKERLIEYLKSHPDASYREVMQNRGFRMTLWHFFDDSLFKAKQEADIPYKKVAKRYSVQKKVASYLEKNGPSLLSDVKKNLKVKPQSVHGLRARGCIEAIKVPGTGYNLYFLGSQKSMAKSLAKKYSSHLGE